MRLLQNYCKANNEYPEVRYCEARQRSKKPCKHGFFTSWRKLLSQHLETQVPHFWVFIVCKYLSVASLAFKGSSCKNRVLQEPLMNTVFIY